LQFNQYLIDATILGTTLYFKLHGKQPTVAPVLMAVKGGKISEIISQHTTIKYLMFMFISNTHQVSFSHSLAPPPVAHSLARSSMAEERKKEKSVSTNG
jgi:hypothetical protein